MKIYRQIINKPISSMVMISLILILLMLSCQTIDEKWQKAKQKNTIEAYQDFLDDNPSSKFEIQARQKIDSLHFELVKDTNTVASYERFIKKHSKSKYIKQAKIKLTLLYIGRLSVLPAYKIDDLKSICVIHPPRYKIKNIINNGNNNWLLLFNGAYYHYNLINEGIGNDGAMQLEDVLNGAEHVWLNSYHSENGLKIESSHKIPLTFKIDRDKGYIYLSGQGKVFTTDGKEYEFSKISEFKELENLLKNPNKLVRQGAVQYLGWLKNKKAVPCLLSVLKDECWEVRRDAAYALGEIKDSTATSYLLNALQDSDDWVVEVSVEALCKILGIGIKEDPWLSILDTNNPNILAAITQVIEIAKGDRNAYRKKLRRQLYNKNNKKIKENIIQCIKKLSNQEESYASGTYTTNCGTKPSVAKISGIFNTYSDDERKSLLNWGFIFSEGEMCIAPLF